MHVISRERRAKGKKTKHTQNSLMSDRKSSKTRLEKVVLSTVLGLSVGLLQLIREAQFVWAPHGEKSHAFTHTNPVTRINDGYVCRPWICQNFIFDWRQETTMFGLTQNCPEMFHCLSKITILLPPTRLENLPSENFETSSWTVVSRSVSHHHQSLISLACTFASHHLNAILLLIDEMYKSNITVVWK